MRTIPSGVAVMCVLAAWLAMPVRADACISQTVMVSFSYDYSEIVASTNVQVDPWYSPCDQIWSLYTIAYVTLETPYTTLDEVYEYGEWEAMATTSASYGEHGRGWYLAEGHGDVFIGSPSSGHVPIDSDYDSQVVPGPFLEFTGGPTAPVPQHSTGVMVTISVDPWYWVQHVEFQGCTPTGNPYVCEVDTGSVGQKTITAKIDDGPAQGVSDQWLVEVEWAYVSGGTGAETARWLHRASWPPAGGRGVRDLDSVTKRGCHRPR